LNGWGRRKATFLKIKAKEKNSGNDAGDAKKTFA
jgi:hypothetical protein